MMGPKQIVSLGISEPWSNDNEILHTQTISQELVPHYQLQFRIQDPLDGAGGGIPLRRRYSQVILSLTSGYQITIDGVACS